MTKAPPQPMPRRCDPVEFIMAALKLNPAERYDLGLIRVSVRDRRRLADQEDSGITVFADREDFRALGEVAGFDDGWVTLRYCDIDDRAGRASFGFVTLLGKTIFLAVSDSAVEGTLPPADDDMARLGRNAFTEAAIACALAGRVENVFAPFRSRWWRSDLHGTRLQHAIATNLSGCTIWDGKDPVRVHGSDRIINAVNGANAASYADTFKEAVLEKNVIHLRAGEWPHAELLLPLGLRRAREPGPADRRRLSREIELDPTAVDQIKKILEMYAAGVNVRDIARWCAEQGVGMRGPLGVGRTFADYSSHAAAVGGLESLLRPETLDYYQNRRIVRRLSTGLIVDEIRGVELAFDQATRRRYVEVEMGVDELRGTRVPLPWPDGGFLPKESWKAIHKRRGKEPQRSRNRGAAAHSKTEGSAFSGASSWRLEGRECVLAAETPTAYVVRSRAPEPRGFSPHEGRHEATLRKTLFHHRAGEALSASLAGLCDPTEPTVVDQRCDHLEDINARLVGLREQIAGRERRSRRSDEELIAAELGEDDTEIVHWREVGRAERAETARLAGALAALELRLAGLEGAEPAYREESVAADLTLPALVAELLQARSNQRVPREVTGGLRELGVLDTLQGRPHPTKPRAWVFEATATVRLADGTPAQLPISWVCPDSKGHPGNGVAVQEMLRDWADGADLADIPIRYPGEDLESVRRALRSFLGRHGVTRKDLRAAAVDCPIPETRRIIASRALDEPALAAGLHAGLVAQVIAAYFGAASSPRRSPARWCTAGLDDARRILAAFENGSGDPLDVDSLVRLTGFLIAHVRAVIRDSDVVVGVDSRAYEPRRCPHEGCHGRALRFLPTPETGQGLICTTCGRVAEDTLSAVLPAGYRDHWRRSEDGYEIAPSPDVGVPDKTERLVTVPTAAKHLGIPEHVVRLLADTGELRAMRGKGGRGGRRLFRLQDLDRLPKERITSWAARSMPSDDDSLTSGDVTALTGLSQSMLAFLADTGRVPHARDAAGNRRYRRRDIDQIPADVISTHASGMVTIGDIVQASGVPLEMIDSHTRSGQIPSRRTGRSWRRYPLDEALVAIRALDLPVTGGEALVSISAVAAALGTTTRHVSRLVDAGEITVVCSLGGKRRFLLSRLEKTLPQSGDGGLR